MTDSTADTTPNEPERIDATVEAMIMPHAADATTGVQVRAIGRLPGYLATSDGRVFSDKRSRRIELSQVRHRRLGYLRVWLYVDGIRKEFGVHQLVCEAFHGERPDGCEVLHRNGNNTDNRASNVRWGTHAENYQDSRIHGTAPIGERSGRALLSEQDVLTIRERYARGGVLQRELADEYGVSKFAICDIINRRNWRHI